MSDPIFDLEQSMKTTMLWDGVDADFEHGSIFDGAAIDVTTAEDLTTFSEADIESLLGTIVHTTHESDAYNLDLSANMVKEIFSQPSVAPASLATPVDHNLHETPSDNSQHEISVLRHSSTQPASCKELAGQGKLEDSGARIDLAGCTNSAQNAPYITNFRRTDSDAIQAKIEMRLTGSPLLQVDPSTPQQWNYLDQIVVHPALLDWVCKFVRKSNHLQRKDLLLSSRLQSRSRSSWSDRQAMRRIVNRRKALNVEVRRANRAIVRDQMRTGQVEVQTLA